MKKLYVESAGHENNFDFLRFMLATMVIFTHSYTVYGTATHSEPLLILTNFQLDLGTLALNFFFIISGFLVSQSWNHSANYLDFLKKRVLRIYPGFVAVCIVGAFVFAPLGLDKPFNYIYQYWMDVNVRHLVTHSLTLRSPALPETFKTLPCANCVNTSIWTIPFEFICYQFVPVLTLVNRKFFTPALFIAVLASNVYHHDVFQYYNFNVVIKPTYLSFLQGRFSTGDMEYILYFEHYLYFFMAGVCYYTYRNYIPRSPYLLILSAAVMLVVSRWGNVFELVQPLFGSYLLFYFAFSKRIKLYRFAKYGDLSYGIYLYGWPIQQLVLLYLGSRIGVFGVFFIAMILVLPTAYLSWHLIEKPFLSLKNKTLLSTRLIT